MEMTEQLRVINELSAKLNFEEFYAIGFDSYGIKLQGKYSSDKVLKYKEYFKTEPIVGNSGFVHIKVDGLEIVLTD